MAERRTRAETWPFIELTIKAEEVKFPHLSDVVDFLDGFNDLYELLRQQTQPDFLEESQANDDRFDSRPLSDEERLRIVRLSQRSPLTLVAEIPAILQNAASVWALFQIVDRLGNWKLNRDVQKLQRDKLRSELAKNDDRSAQLPNANERPPRKEETTYQVSLALERLSKNPISVKTLEVKFVRRKRSW